MKEAHIKSYRDLIAWQKAMQLAEEIYRATATFPREEIYVLTSQMRRAAVSIACNIAEGHDRQSRGEYVQFLGHARGSLSELETQTELVARLGLLPPDRKVLLVNQMAEVGRISNGLRRSLHEPSKLNQRSRAPK
jgi:four helix bundle protein